MIRPFTVLCLLAACGSGLYLYSEKHRTELLDRDIGRVIRTTEAARARTGLLRAEWALLNEPGRLQDMAGRYLTLRPMAPTQFVQVSDLAAHLPAPVTIPSSAETDDDDTAEAPDVAVAANPPAEPAQAAPAVAAPPPEAKPAPKLLASNTAHPRAQHHAIQLAERQDPPAHDGVLTRGTPLPLAAPQPMGASVYSAMARPMPVSSARPAIVSAVPSYAPARSYGGSYVPSALGGGTALPPPIPYGR